MHHVLIAVDVWNVCTMSLYGRNFINCGVHLETLGDNFQEELFFLFFILLPCQTCRLKPKENFFKSPLYSNVPLKYFFHPLWRLNWGKNEEDYYIQFYTEHSLPTFCVYESRFLILYIIYLYLYYLYYLYI